MFRRWFYAVSALLVVGLSLLGMKWSPAWWILLGFAPLILLGLRDALQTRHAILRNWPLIGRFRYAFESIRPEIQQYFVEGDTDGKPIHRNFRSVVYQRAKHELDTLPFGTQRDVYEPGYEWMTHSMAARAWPIEKAAPRVTIGGRDCTQPYSASYLNISAMSYGSLSSNAVLALNGGAAKGGFYHNTGEGGISPYHKDPGGDLVWQIGTGYFGCRARDGGFDPEAYKEEVAHPSVRMVELKLSQGAKPGHGGILPAKKVTPEIAKIRRVVMGEDVLSPPSHREFDSPTGMLTFVAKLRELSGGKPVGIKLCVGDATEVMGLCKAMRDTQIMPDFIAVDGGEGGTGAAPLEFSNSVGWPLREGLAFVHAALLGAGLRDQTKLVASGKIITGFHMVRALALGADLCNSARAMMLALGCIQARRCNSNHCPVGVATQTQSLIEGLVVSDKTERVYRYHRETVHSLLELTGAAGLEDPRQILPQHVWRRMDERSAQHYAELYPLPTPGCLIQGSGPAELVAAWNEASADHFRQALGQAS